MVVKLRTLTFFFLIFLLPLKEFRPAIKSILFLLGRNFFPLSLVLKLTPPLCGQRFESTPLRKPPFKVLEETLMLNAPLFLLSVLLVLYSFSLSTCSEKASFFLRTFSSWASKNPMEMPAQSPSFAVELPSSSRPVWDGFFLLVSLDLRIGVA